MVASDPVPDDVLRVDTTARSVAMHVASASYPVGAIYGAAYLFLDRCWVFLDRPDEAHVRVTLSWRREPADGAQRAAVAEFAEELVSCAWRAEIAQETRALIEGATSRAHSGSAAGSAADGGPSLEALASYDFGEEALKDPLGLALKWEEKHATGDRTAAAPHAEAASPTTPATKTKEEV
jgi:His-Xaa-Ser system protein HxsD